jgi:hypothetical protein
MYRRALTAVVTALLLLGLAPGGFAQDAKKPVVIEGKKILPLRVLCRPFSSVYKSPDESSGTARENVAAFTSFYVYTRPSAEDREMEGGWYEVGTDNRGSTIGWMKSSDVFEWKQTMCLAYTHPQDRKPVLMFDGRAPLDALLGKSRTERVSEAEKLYQTIAAGAPPADFPVVSVEPQKYIDMSEQFYLLPILSFDTVELDGREGRVVRLAAVTAGQRRRSQGSQDRHRLGHGHHGFHAALHTKDHAGGARRFRTDHAGHQRGQGNEVRHMGLPRPGGHDSRHRLHHEQLHPEA